MKCLTPFWDLAIFPRYLTQFGLLARNMDEFHIIYIQGQVKKEWRRDFIFHKMPMPKGLRYLNWIKAIKTMYEKVKLIDVDFYYCLSGLWLQYSTYYFSKKTGKPNIIRLRGEDYKVGQFHKRNWFRKKLRDIFYSQSFKNASLVIPITENVLWVAKEYKAKNILNPIVLGVDTDLFRPKEVWDRNKNFNVGFVGRVSKEKGSVFFNKLMESTPEINYKIVGWINDPEFKIPSNCEFLGTWDYRSMPLFYNSVDLVIIPSFFEGFSNVVLEAYSCGKLIMIGKAVLTPEIKLFGYALDMDLDTWVNKLGYLNEMKLKYGEIARARNARKFIIENFSWGLYEKRMISAFKSVLNES